MASLQTTCKQGLNSIEHVISHSSLGKGRPIKRVALKGLTSGSKLSSQEMTGRTGTRKLIFIKKYKVKNMVSAKDEAQESQTPTRSYMP